MSDGLRLNGAVAVVTGGASGIGAACCRLLETNGAEVHVVDRDGEPPLDVTDRAALDRISGSLERLDVLVNAAGVPRRTVRSTSSIPTTSASTSR